MENNDIRACMQTVIAKTNIDRMIRFLHLVILVSFTGAYFTGDVFELHQVHMLFGYLLAIALGIRILWQFLAMKLVQSQPFSWVKRQQIGLNFFKLGKQQPLQSQKAIQFLSGALLQLSILLIFTVLPVTVILGYITETTGRDDIKEIHDFFANFFLAVVIGHLAAILINSFVTKQIMFKKMFWGNQPFSWKEWGIVGCVIGLMVGFGLWFLLT